MTEHVHEWELKAYLYVGVPIFGCKIKDCHEKLAVRQAEARINATERLSAEDVTLLSDHVMYMIITGHLSDGASTKAHIARRNAIAYANTLEGK